MRAASLLADPEATFSLRSVYAFPNPAVGGQKPTIHVAVGKADRVTIRIYDIAGTPVHETTLDGSPSVVNDDSGAHFAYEYSWAGHIPSGVYLYTITAEKAGNAPIKRVGKLAVVR
ncbi:MAG: T9SS type A sorting domain-containing protein [Elusimicrobia bacterium]|nr:T9SS type A sorting domain-containing protein [Elusimicrobiota bacterium]